MNLHTLTLRTLSWTDDLHGQQILRWQGLIADAEKLRKPKQQEARNER